MTFRTVPIFQNRLTDLVDVGFAYVVQGVNEPSIVSHCLSCGWQACVMDCGSNEPRCFPMLDGHRPHNILNCSRAGTDVECCSIGNVVHHSAVVSALNKRVLRQEKRLGLARGNLAPFIAKGAAPFHRVEASELSRPTLPFMPQKGEHLLAAPGRARP